MNDKEIKEACGIKIGEYIRTENGEIFIVDEISWYEKEELYFYDSPKNCGGCWSDQVKKHSFNIIDIIEVGDYVNGYKVYDISTEYLVDINKEGKILHIEKEGFINATITEREDDIKSICTREQFENAKYKVEE